MKVFIQCDKNGLPYNPNSYAAYDGFKEMGCETVMFPMPGEVPEGNPEDVVVGGIGTVRKALRRFGVNTDEITYPNSIKKISEKRRVGKHLRQCSIKSITLAYLHKAC